MFLGRGCQSTTNRKNNGHKWSDFASSCNVWNWREFSVPSGYKREKKKSQDSERQSSATKSSNAHECAVSRRGKISSKCAKAWNKDYRIWFTRWIWLKNVNAWPICNSEMNESTFAHKKNTKSNALDSWSVKPGSAKSSENSGTECRESGAWKLKRLLSEGNFYYGSTSFNCKSSHRWRLKNYKALKR